MKRFQLHPKSALAGFALASVAFLTMSQSTAPAAASFEYKMLEDVKEDDIKKATADGWEYVGYLGQGTKGSGNDQTLWRRHKK